MEKKNPACIINRISCHISSKIKSQGFLRQLLSGINIVILS